MTVVKAAKGIGILTLIVLSEGTRRTHWVGQPFLPEALTLRYSRLGARSLGPYCSTSLEYHCNHLPKLRDKHKTRHPFVSYSTPHSEEAENEVLLAPMPQAR